MVEFPVNWLEGRATRGRDLSARPGAKDGDSRAVHRPAVSLLGCRIGTIALNPRGSGGQRPLLLFVADHP